MIMSDDNNIDAQLWDFDEILDHRRVGKSYQVLVKWKNYKPTWEPLSVFSADASWECALYAEEHGLLQAHGWKRFQRVLEREEKSPNEDEPEVSEREDDEEEEEEKVEKRFLSKDGEWYPTYMDMVEANKRHNQARIRSLGLDQFRPTQPPKKQQKRRKPSSPTAATPSRRSDRLRMVTPEPHEQSLSQEDDDKETVVVISPRRPYKRRKVNADAPVALTQDQRQKLHREREETWIEEMEDYLLNVEKVSGTNCRDTLRQVSALASGNGVTYQRWPQNTFFAKGMRVNLSFDMGQLYQQAVEYEDTYGRDLGNGWLMRHPIRKMERFQHYLVSMEK